MAKSVSRLKQARVQKVCTLWTHDDNFSRDELVFNGEKFPELPTAPGTLLRIVSISAGVAARDYQPASKNGQDGMNHARTGDTEKGADGNSHLKRSRRGSLTVTIDENGSTIPGGRDIDTEKGYIFVAKPLPLDLKSKHPNLQISLSETVAKVFGFRNRMQVILTEADEDRHEAHHVELVFRDEYLTRGDMWRLAVSELSKRTIYRHQKLLFMGTVKATVKHIYIDGQSVHSGYSSPKTKPIFRSESARYVLFIQMSREMWDFDAEGAGEIMFNKVVSGFLPDLFKRWLKINARHLVTIILFTRMQYDGESLSDRPHDNTSDSESDSKSGTFRDYYRVVVSDMASGDWINILYQLKKEFRRFLREVSLVPKSEKHSTMKRGGVTSDDQNTIIAGRPSSASQGNVLEAINLAAASFSKDYIDRDLVRTGISVIVVTPGTGVFEVDYNTLKLTTDTLVGSGIAIDLVCLSPVPLHSVPLFRYKNPEMKSDTKDKEDSQTLVEKAFQEDDKTPRQHQSNFGSLSKTPTIQALPELIRESALRSGDISEDWRFAMPYWIDVSFWSGTSEEIPELTKPRKADKVVKASRKKGRIFALRCRLYELQMMGVVENDLGDICIPYLFEDNLYPYNLRRAFGPSEEKPRMKSLLLDAPENSTVGSYSTQGDKDYHDSNLDESKAAHKTWMEVYDEEVFSKPKRGQTIEDRYHEKERNKNRRSLSASPELSRGSYLSGSFRGSGWTFDKAGRSGPEKSFHQLMRERSRGVEGQSPRGSSFQPPENKEQGFPRPDGSQRQKALARGTADLQRSIYHRRGRSGDSEDHHQSLKSTPVHSPGPSRGSSPPRRPELSPANSTIISRGDLKSRPSNWFLRQISFGGKAEALKPTIGDATIDISQGKVKPAMLTVEKNQKGAIAERLASTRLTISEKPSQPIAIRTASRAGPLSIESLSAERTSRSIETVRGTESRGPSTPPNFKSAVKDPGSTFLLAGSRALGDSIGPKPDLSSSAGARDVPRTLSPTSAIAPWAVLVNPCNPKKNSVNSQNQYRRWHHVFPRAQRTGSVKWKSLCSPAAVPLTHDWFPSAEQVATEYYENPYRITQNDDEEMAETPKSRESLIKELIAFRLSHGYQITVGSSVAEFSGRQEKSLASILAPEYMSSDGDTIFMSSGSNIHQLMCVAGGEVEVRRYIRKPTTTLESTVGIGTPFPYRPYIRTALEPNYKPLDIVLRPTRHDINWNIIDTFLAGYNDEFSDVLRFWRARFVLIPVEMPTINRRPLPMLAEDSEEEIRLEGIRKLTQMWQKFRHFPPDERPFQPTTSVKQKDPNPLAIEYYTRDPSAVVAASSDHSLFADGSIEFQSSIFPDADKYHTSNIDIKKLAEDLQGEKGIQMLDRRWHWKLYYNCFLGFDLTSWLLSKFKDITTRDEAVELGNELMNKGLFQHVQKRHQFRDGNFFFQIAADYRAPRPESRMGWFGMRKAEKSVPATPVAEAVRPMTLAPKSLKARPSTADSSSSRSSIEQGEKTPTRAGSPKRQVTLSRVMRYDVDPRKRSYRPEIVSLHYDCIHNPDNCYHIRIEWMNVTAKFIEDVITTWATSVDKYGLKLVELPIAEAANVVGDHPFRSPYTVKLALQPPEPQPEPNWESAHLSPQYAKTDTSVYHKALLRKLNFVLDMEAAKAFPSDANVTYSWGKPDYKYTQFIHRSGNCLAQITDEGHFLLLANRLASHRSKDNSRIRPTDPHEHKKATTDGSQSSRMPSTPSERPNPHRSPFASPLARPVQEPSLLHTALTFHEKSMSTGSPGVVMSSMTPEQIKDEVEEFCSNKESLSAFYKEAFEQAPSPSPRILPVQDDKIPSLGLPPAISIREASPATAGRTVSSTFAGRSERLSDMASIGSSSMTLGKRGSIMDMSNTDAMPRRRDSQGSSGGSS